MILVMWIVLIFQLFEFLHRRTVLVVGPQKDKVTPQSAKTVSGKKREVGSDDDGDEAAAGRGSPQASYFAVKKRKINGVVSMKGLVLSNAVPSKGRDDDAMTLFDAKLSWSQSYHSHALFTLVMCGKEHPVEKARHLGTRMKIMYSAQLYSISGEQLSEILEAEQEQSKPICMACLRQLSRSCAMDCTANLKSAMCSMKRY